MEVLGKPKIKQGKTYCNLMLLQFAAITTIRLADLNLGHASDPVLNDDIDKVIRVCAGICGADIN